MDPNATLQAMLDAIANSDRDTLAEYSGYLSDWLSKGGFAPTALEGFADELLTIATELPVATGRREVDECSETDCDFRIFVRPNGGLELSVGDPSFDTNHRGYCGAGSVNTSDDMDDCLTAVFDAFWQAIDAAAEDIDRPTDPRHQ